MTSTSPEPPTIARLRKIFWKGIGNKLFAWCQRRKYTLSSLLVGICVGVFLVTRSALFVLVGEIDGTHYHIRYVAKRGKNYQQQIDALLLRLYHTLSLKFPHTTLQRFNQQNCQEFLLTLQEMALHDVVIASKRLYKATGGKFDPTFRLYAPLHPSTGSSSTSFTSFDQIVVNTDRLKKLKEGVQLDFSAVLQGHSADAIAAFLQQQGVQKFMIEVGTTRRKQGHLIAESPSKIWLKFPKARPWHRPSAVVPFMASGKHANEGWMMLPNGGVATAKRFQKIFRQNNATYLRTMTPIEDYRAENRLLSATVIAPDAFSASAYATVMMAGGFEAAQELATKTADLEAFLVYIDATGQRNFYVSEGLKMTKQGKEIYITTAPVAAE